MGYAQGLTATAPGPRHSDATEAERLIADGMVRLLDVRTTGEIGRPSRWLLENADLLGGGRALDIACGRGRHALLLAAAGWQVHAVDRDAAAVDKLRGVAQRLGLDAQLDLDVRDLEAGEVDLGEAAYDLVVVTRYLHRPLFPAFHRALRPGGILLYETFTTAHVKRGRPRNPAFLLEPGELPRLVAPLTVARADEGDRDGQMVSAVVARKPAAESA